MTSVEVPLLLHSFNSHRMFRIYVRDEIIEEWRSAVETEGDLKSSFLKCWQLLTLSLVTL